MAMLAGGGLSLVFCGQFGTAFSGFAKGLNHMLHFKTGSLACVLLCASLFAVFPSILLRIICGRLLTRVIVKNHKHVIFTCLFLWAIFLAFHSPMKIELLNLLVWLLFSFLSIKVISKFIIFADQRISSSRFSQTLQ